MPITAEGDYNFVSKEWLLAELRGDSKSIVMLDCRSSNEYGESHIREAVNFSIPSIMLRRLAAGKIDLVSTIKCRELKAKISKSYKENLFILYNDQTEAQQHSDSVLSVLLRRLTQDGCRVVCLEDSFSSFRCAYPEWCDTGAEILGGLGVGGPGGTGVGDPLPLVGLRSLKISTEPALPHQQRLYDTLFLSSAANSSTDSSDCDDRCDSSLGLEDDREFPVEILQYLFLGNASNSEDSQSLAKHNIQYILNVTPDLPNVFENVGNIKYLQIPIADHWSQNMASHFPEAIEFIDEARTRQKGVLVHCLAGISRSVTITMAYLMFKCSLNLNDAFNMVRARKANIAPNFHFLEQLHSYEKELQLEVRSQQSPNYLLRQIRAHQSQHNHHHHHRGATCIGATRGRPCPNCALGAAECQCRQHTEFLSPLAQVGVSPDSGIEFDRWAGGPGPGGGGGGTATSAD